jgi:hypothetical protein
MITVSKALNKVCHWGMLLAGRIGGTLRAEDPRSKGYRDLFQKYIALRTEVSALTHVLVKRRIITTDEFARQIIVEATELDKIYEAQFPGFITTDDGLEIVDVEKASAVMKGWPK